MVAVDDVIWDAVKPHSWKYSIGRQRVRGILWHSTRSGRGEFTVEQEYGATLNWFRSPNNLVRDNAGNPWYGALTHYVIGGGRVCLALPEEHSPRYSAGVHDEHAISVEVAQATPTTPYDPRDIKLARRLAEDLAERYGFPLRRIPFVDGGNIGWPGEVGHEDTEQGRRQGKSDPGPLFWAQYLAPEEAEMADNARLARLEALLAGNGVDVTVEAKHANALAAAGVTAKVGERLRLTGEAALAFAHAMGWSITLGLGQVRVDVEDLGRHHHTMDVVISRTGPAQR